MDRSPYAAIAPVTLLWHPVPKELQSEQRIGSIPPEERQVWVWVHPAAFGETFLCLQTTCERQVRHVIQLGLWSLLVQYCFLLLSMDTPCVHMGKAIVKWIIYPIFASTIEAWSYFLPLESPRARWSVFGMLFYSTESLALLLLMSMKVRASSLNYYILPQK